jgi:hypothetical protein
LREAGGANVPANPDGSAKVPEQKLCFIIGPIGKPGTPERKHADLLLHSVIKHVLEDKEFGYKVRRADEDADPGMIGDRMISDLIHADLVVVDLTDLNANAFYELGIRHATEKPTIHIAKAGTILPFDNVSHRTIFVDLADWYSSEDARKRLAESARAILRPDYKVSNPITQANASFKMRESADPTDRLWASLSERLHGVENALSPKVYGAQKVDGKLRREMWREGYVFQFLANAHDIWAVSIDKASAKKVILEEMDKHNPPLELRVVLETPKTLWFEFFDDRGNPRVFIVGQDDGEDLHKQPHVVS